MKEIKANTIDFRADIYDDDHDCEFRVTVSRDPDFPGVLIIKREEWDEVARQYKCEGAVAIDRDMWDKIKYAVDTIFEKTI